MTFVRLRPTTATPAGLSWLGRASRLMAAAVLTLPLAACGSFDSLSSLDPTTWFAKKYTPKVIPDVPPAKLYDQGLAGIQTHNYEAAAKKFNQLQKQDQYTQWQRKALLMAAFSQFQNGNYNDAIGSAQHYISLYSSAPDLDYAYYIEAMSYYNQIPDISHDQSAAIKAAKLFQDIIQKFPKSVYVNDARYKLQVARDQLAGRDMMVGRYYLKRRDYAGAISRFRDVLFKYQTTREAQEALERLTEAYLALGIDNEAQTAAAVLGHNFPGSPWYKDAYNLLKKGGLKPHEDPTSWISKAFRKVGLG